jgi:hypothetical protein
MEDVSLSGGELLHIYVCWISRYLSVIQSYHDLSTGSALRSKQTVKFNDVMPVKPSAQV